MIVHQITKHIACLSPSMDCKELASEGAWNKMKNKTTNQKRVNEEFSHSQDSYGIKSPIWGKGYQFDFFYKINKQQQPFIGRL